MLSGSPLLDPDAQLTSTLLSGTLVVLVAVSQVGLVLVVEVVRVRSVVAVALGGWGECREW